VPFWGPFLTGLRKFSPKNCLTMGMLPLKLQYRSTWNFRTVFGQRKCVRRCSIVTSQQIQDGGRPPIWRSLNHHISVKNCAILIKFGTLQQILNPMTVTWPKIEIFKIFKIAFLAITHRPIVRLQRNFVWGSRTACRQGLNDKICKYLKSKMADGRHFENC